MFVNLDLFSIKSNEDGLTEIWEIPFLTTVIYLLQKDTQQAWKICNLWYR